MPRLSRIPLRLVGTEGNVGGHARDSLVANRGSGTLLSQLSVFQRTPPWVVPKLDFAIPERWRKRFKSLPLFTWLFRTVLFWLYELRVLSFLGDGGILRKRGDPRRRKLQ